MSGVVYGLFGYVWIRSVFNPIPGLHLSQANVIILLGWLFLCMTGVMGPIANVAHVVGLVVGATFAYVPSLWRK
jgi:GlpG protein